MSHDYYDRNAAAFFADTVTADMRDAHKQFLAHVPPGGAILDAGCGSGRDAKAFVQSGYLVEAFDASAEMVRLASELTGLPVRRLSFEEIDWNERFDGIWASASLLHVPRSELPGVAQRLQRALKREGVLYVSFKYGTEEREKEGRRFTDMTEELLRDALLSTTALELVDLWTSQDVRRGREHERWLSALLRR